MTEPGTESGGADEAGIAPERLIVEGLRVSFGMQTVLQNLSLRVRSGRTLVIPGPSGCGKSTLLKAIAGLIVPAEGRVMFPLINSDPSAGLSDPQMEGPLYLDQEPLLFEHLSVFENVAFALRMKRASESLVTNRVNAVLLSTGLVAEAGKRPHQLSGGQKQRVAFARAVIARPQVLLLDEPFSALDADTRSQMQTFFCELKAQYPLTAVFVTHDVREALTVGTDFARMVNGALRTYGTRKEFINDPATGVLDEIQFWQEAAGQREDS